MTERRFQLRQTSVFAWKTRFLTFEVLCSLHAINSKVPLSAEVNSSFLLLSEACRRPAKGLPLQLCYTLPKPPNRALQNGTSATQEAKAQREITGAGRFPRRRLETGRLIQSFRQVRVPCSCDGAEVTLPILLQIPGLA